MLLIFSIGLICIMPIPLKHLAILLQDLVLMMELLSLILLNIEVLLGLFNIWHLHDLILHLVLNNCINFLHYPTTIHSEDAKRVLRYVNGTLLHGFFLFPGPLSLSAFSNANWAKDPCNRMSTTSFIIFMGSNPISWSFKKKTTVSRLSTEAKYRALATTAAEVH